MVRVLPAVPSPYESPGLGWRRSNRRHRGTPNSDSLMPSRHPRGHGGCASPSPQRAYPMTSITHPSLEDGGQIEVLSEKLATNTPIQQRTPALEFVDGGNNVIHISESNKICDFLKSAFPDHGSRLLPPDLVACSERRRNVVDLDELRLGQTVEPRGIPGTVHRVGGPFVIGTHGPNIQDVCLIPLLLNA